MENFIFCLVNTKVSTTKNYLIFNFTMKDCISAAMYVSSVSSSCISIELYRIVLKIKIELLWGISKRDISGAKFKRILERIY